MPISTKGWSRGTRIGPDNQIVHSRGPFEAYIVDRGTVYGRSTWVLLLNGIDVGLDFKAFSEIRSYVLGYERAINDGLCED